MLYTSGTTGKPKGAVLTQLNMVMNAQVMATTVVDLRPADVILGCLPLFHSFGQTCAMNAGFYAGATLVMVPRFDPGQALDLMITAGVNVFEGVPTMYVGLLAAARDDPRRPQLKSAVSGGASLPVAIIDRFAETFGVDIDEGYGLSARPVRSPRSTSASSVARPAPSDAGCGGWKRRSPRPTWRGASTCSAPGRSARWSSGATTCSPGTWGIRRRPRRCWSTAGSAAVTWGSPTRTASSRSSTARTT